MSKNLVGIPLRFGANERRVLVDLDAGPSGAAHLKQVQEAIEVMGDTCASAPEFFQRASELLCRAGLPPVKA